jgi:hypothetical protein
MRHGVIHIILRGIPSIADRRFADHRGAVHRLAPRAGVPPLLQIGLPQYFFHIPNVKICKAAIEVG